MTFIMKLGKKNSRNLPKWQQAQKKLNWLEFPNFKMQTKLVLATQISVRLSWHKETVQKAWLLQV